MGDGAGGGRRRWWWEWGTDRLSVVGGLTRHPVHGYDPPHHALPKFTALMITIGRVVLVVVTVNGSGHNSSSIRYRRINSPSNGSCRSGNFDSSISSSSSSSNSKAEVLVLVVVIVVTVIIVVAVVATVA